MQLSIITLNYNKSDLTINCINSLLDNFEKELRENLFEVIIVDNASEMTELKKLKSAINSKNLKHIKIIENKENEGFSKGCNIGAKNAGGEHLLFLNNDSKVLDRGIYEMYRYIKENNEVSILGGQLKNASGEKQVSTGKFYNLFSTLLLLLGFQRIGAIDKSPEKVSRVDWVKGALFMVKKEVFDVLSGFDENIFMYTEDMDFCYRAKKKGYNSYFYPNVNIIHLDQGSSDRSFAVVQIYKGILYFYKKHKSLPEYQLVKTILYIKAIVAISLGTLTGNSYLKSTFKKAIQF